MQFIDDRSYIPMSFVRSNGPELPPKKGEG